MENDSLYNAAEQVKNSLAKITAIRSMLAGEELTINDIYTLKGIDIINKYLDAPLYDPIEATLKKAVTAAVIATKEKLEVDDSNEKIAVAVSEGLLRLKTQYLAGTGEIISTEAHDLQLDHAVAAFAVSVEQKIDGWLEELPDNLAELTDKQYDKLVHAITLGIATFAPDGATVVAPFINTIAQSLRSEVVSIIRNGAKAIVRRVKPTIQNMVNKGVEFSQNLLKRLGLIKQDQRKERHETAYQSKEKEKIAT